MAAFTAVILGRMPPLMMPLASKPASSSRVAWGIREEVLVTSLSRPGTDSRMNSFSAPMAEARLAAMVSALVL